MFMYRMTQPEEIQPEEIRPEEIRPEEIQPEEIQPEEIRPVVIPAVIPVAEETVEILMPAAMQVMQSRLLNRVHPVKQMLHK